MKQRLLATFLSLCLLVGLLPTVALAEESPASETQGEASEQQATATDSTLETTTDLLSGNSTDGTMSGTCGATEQDNVRWTLNKNGETVTIDGEPEDAYTLTISGTGAMMDYSNISSTPWVDFRSVITHVDLTEGLTTIGSRAFSATAVTTCRISSTVQEIKNDAFSSSKLAHVEFAAPSKLESIGAGAFWGTSELKMALVLPDSLKTIGNLAFQRSGITSVKFGENLKTIGANAFCSCPNLTGEVYLPDSLENLGNYAFNTSPITSVRIGPNIKTWGGSVFNRSTTNPEKVHLTDGNGVLTISGGVNENTVVNSQFAGLDFNAVLVNAGNELTFKSGSMSHYDTNIYALVFLKETLPQIDENAFMNTYPTVIYGINNEIISWSSTAGPCLAVTNGGTFGKDTVFESGRLATPTKDGAIFDGWYDNEQCSGTVVDSPTVGQTYYAKWTESTYSVTERPLVFGSVTYGATVEAKTITVAGLDDSVTLTAVSSDEGIFTATASGSEVTVAPKVNLDVGTYNEVITITTPDDATFFVDVSITIEQAPTSIGITAKPTSLTGGGTVTLTVTKTGLPQDAQVSVSGYSNITDNGDGTYTVALPNSTATYTFTASYAGDANHKDATANCTVFVTQYTGGGSSSSGSSSVSGSGDNVIITASSGTVTDAQMESAVKKANKGSTITIKATSSTTVTLPVGGMADAADNNNDVLLDLRYGEVTLSARAIAGMTDGVSSNDKIKVSVTSQTNSKDETISDLLDKGGAVFDVSVEVDGVEIHSFDGTLTITLTVSNLSKISDPHVLHILTDGTKEYYAPDRISGNTITVKGVRNLSTFAVIPGSEVPQTNPFTDVTTSDYYYDAVLWAVANGVTNGSSATTFSPNVAVSRAQMVTFLWRVHGSPEATGTNPFTDVSTSDYYYDAVLWAVANGVTNGTSATTFSPDTPVTRAQAVTFQWRAAGSPVVSGSSFGDVAADAYYVNAVTWAVANGITNGTGGNTFSPDVVVSRAQAVTFLYREQE